MYGLSREEFVFGVLAASIHGCQHLFLRLFPPLIPILAVDLGASFWQLGLLVSVYMFAGGLFQAPMGVLSDRVDRRHLLVVAFLAMGVGYLVFVFAPRLGADLPALTLLGHTFDGTFQLMAVGMFVAGIGYSAIHPVGYPLISANVAPENKGKVLGMWGSASKVGDAAAPLLVGALIIAIAWEWILVGISLFGFAFAAFLALVFRRGAYETRPPATTADEDDGDVVRELLAAPRTFLFPMAAVVASFFFILFAGNGLLTYTPAFVTDVYGYSGAVLGVAFGPESIANFYFGLLLISGAVAQLVVGSVADASDHRLVLLVLLGLGGCGLLVLAALPLGPLMLAVAFVALGATLFGLNPARDALISDITPPAYEGRTFGYIWTLALVGSSGYPIVIGYIADTMGLRVSFGVLAVGAVGGMACIALLFSSRVYRRRDSAPAAAD